MEQTRESPQNDYGFKPPTSVLLSKPLWAQGAGHLTDHGHSRRHGVFYLLWSAFKNKEYHLHCITGILGTLSFFDEWAGSSLVNLPGSWRCHEISLNPFCGVWRGPGMETGWKEGILHCFFRHLWLVCEKRLKLFSLFLHAHQQQWAVGTRPGRADRTSPHFPSPSSHELNELHLNSP